MSVGVGVVRGCGCDVQTREAMERQLGGCAWVGGSVGGWGRVGQGGCKCGWDVGFILSMAAKVFM